MTYGELHLGSSWVFICLQNVSIHPVEIPSKAVAGQVMPANQVLPVVLPEETLMDPPATPKRMDLGGPGPPRPRGMTQG